MVRAFIFAFLARDWAVLQHPTGIGLTLAISGPSCTVPKRWLRLQYEKYWAYKLLGEAADFCNSSFFKEPQLASSRPRILKLKAYLLESWHERSGFTVGTASVGFGLVGLGLVVPVVWGMPAHLYSVLIFFTSISLNPFLCPSLQLPRFPFFLIVAFPFYKKNYRHASEIVEHSLAGMAAGGKFFAAKSYCPSWLTSVTTFTDEWAIKAIICLPAALVCAILELLHT